MPNMKFSDYERNLITRICYEFYYEPWRLLIKNPPSFFSVLKAFLKKIIHFLRHPDLKQPEIHDVIFFSTTLNNDRALKPVWEKISPADYSVWKKDEIFSETKILLYSFLHILDFIMLYLKSSQEDKLLLRQYNYWFMEAYGYYKVIKNFVKKNRHSIKLMVMANDHSPVNRCLIEHCKKYCVKTLYIQHAAVDATFPTNIFTYSFLDGTDAYYKYSKYTPIEGKTFLVGSPRFDAMITDTNAEYIGIGTNEIDDMNMVLDLCSFLISNGYKNLMLRPHPRQQVSDEIKEKLTSMGILFSESKDLTSFVFLSKLKLLIANETSLHFDAMLQKVPSVKFNFANKPYEDAYDFVSLGALKYCKTYAEVLQQCKNPTLSSYEKIKSWNAALGTKYDGHVSDLIANCIKGILAEDNEAVWINSIFKYNDEGFYEYK